MFCSTDKIRAEIKNLTNYQMNDWEGFVGNQKTFAILQKDIRKELDYLRGFWLEDCVDNIKFWRWNCLKAFDDIPEKNKVYLNREKKWSLDHIDKYDVLHDRTAYLSNLDERLWSLFHDWQYVTQGWTSY